MTYENAANITITQPANIRFTAITLSIAANSTNSFDLTPFLASIESPAGGVVSNTGLRILSTGSIRAFYELGAASNKEIFSLKGTKALGTNFYTPFQKHWNNGGTTPASFSSIEILAIPVIVIINVTLNTHHCNDY